ncbi:hypothetical protein NC652_027799 [Populus alba x Populus x berolinensis]|nr:hypothetical protein NC652_027799 [Populus alba x Populus x berolinensis]
MTNNSPFSTIKNPLSFSRHQTEIQNPVEVSGSAFRLSLPPSPSPSPSLSLSHSLSPICLFRTLKKVKGTYMFLIFSRGFVLSAKTLYRQCRGNSNFLHLEENNMPWTSSFVNYSRNCVRLVVFFRVIL